jgi:hypothetical protein
MSGMRTLGLLASASALTVWVAGCEKEAVPAGRPAPSSAPAAPAPAPPTAAGSGAAQVVTAAGVSFPLPQGWKQVPPGNAMRLAEVQVPGPSGGPEDACTVVFSTAGGDVQGNISRWAGQVRDASGQPSTASVQTRTTKGLKVHIAEMTGTYSGMNESPRTDWMLRGAIIETSSGLLFVKMTGPTPAMTDAGPGFMAMIDGLSPR